MKHGPHSLAAMNWQDFQGFVVKVLKHYYGQSGIKLIHGPFQADSGRDGHAVLTLRSDLKDPLEILARLWVEVKQRRGVPVSRTDIHGQVLLAFLESVTKLVVVTNSTFSRELQEAVRGFASRLRLQYALIDGDALISLAYEAKLSVPGGMKRRRVQTAARAATQGRVLLRWTLGADPAKPFGPGAGVYRIPGGDPVFLLAEVEGIELQRPIPFELQVTRRPPETGPEERFHPKSEMLGQCDCIRFSWPFWLRDNYVDTSDFRIELRYPSGFQGVEVQEAVTFSRCQVNHSILGEDLPSSRSLILGQLTNQLKLWKRDDGFRCLALISSAGSGKSHLLRMLRQVWMQMEVEELYLEGGVHNTDRDVFSRICDVLVPMRDLLAEPEDIDALRAMLKLHHFSDTLAELIVDWIVFGETSNQVGRSEVLLGRSLGRLIAHRAKKAATIVSFDDLHKTRPSVLAILTEAVKEIRENRDAKVFFVLASREVSLSSQSSTRALWHRKMDELLLAADPYAVSLPGLSTVEAAELLQHVVPRLHRSQCEEIFEVVGRTPFALREALAFLRDTDVLFWDNALREYLPRNTVPIDQLRNLKSLSEVTQCRLRAIREGLDGNVLDFLDAGACLGRIFRNDHARLATNASDARDLEIEIGELEQLEILRPSRFGPDWVEFDHDLIRRATLAILPRVRHRRVAGSLLDGLDAKTSSRTTALLAYQAGRAEQCLHYSTAEAEAARKDRRFADEAEVLGLAISVLEPTSAVHLGLGPEDSAFILDDAIALSSPVTLSPSPDPLTTRKQVLDYLRRLAIAASHVGSGSSEIVERAATEALMLAEGLLDFRSSAQCSALLGRVLFERDRVKASKEQHEQAESAFTQLGDDAGLIDRADNLVRLGISERELGQLESSRDHLKMALRIGGTDPEVLVNAVTNLGASYFHVDWEKTRQHWEKALRLARRRDLVDQDVHLSLDLNRLNILEGELEKARCELDRIERIVDQLRLDYPRLRFLNQRGILLALTGDLALAERMLKDAEQYAIEHRSIRRVWKIRANLATIYEAQENLAEAYAQDSLAEADASRLLSDETLTRPTPQRALMPIANILLRREMFPGYPALIERMPRKVSELARPLAEAVEKSRLSSIPFSLARHCVRVENRRRFVTA